MSARVKVRVLALSLHGRRVAYLAGYQTGKNVLIFDEGYKHDPGRPTFSLITHPNFPKATTLLNEPWVRNQRLHPVLSNLLPEGVLRELVVRGLKVHTDNEFELITYLGQDLPGALVVTPVAPEDVPGHILDYQTSASSVIIQHPYTTNRFSLAGVQMKFSLKERDGRYHLRHSGELGDWIIKTPSTHFRQVPENEYTAMRLAQLAGVDIPEIRLVAIDALEKLPQISLPDEKLAFAIKRFDRDGEERIHMEDFAQVLVKHSSEKYGSANYEQLGKILYDYTGDSLANIQQFARRLLVNILLANGDAHLKNWSLLYRNRITPELSPAYDIVTTAVYIAGETQFALNLAKIKAWYRVTLEHFQTWATSAGIPWRAIRPHLVDTMDRARNKWPAALEELPMNDEHKAFLVTHWQTLQDDFRIG